MLLLFDGEKVTSEDFDRWVFPFISLGWSLGVEINPVAYAYGEWQLRKITPIYKNVMREGVELCSRTKKVPPVEAYINKIKELVG